MLSLKAQSTSFVLLATNFPQALDSAALRCVPCKLNLGLPGLASRRQLFHNYLRDDSIASDARLEDLACRTKRHSGADIQAACFHAAVVCNDEAPDDTGSGGGDGGVVMSIQIAHFLEGFRRIPPSVTGESLTSIRKFSRASDPAALLDEDSSDAAALDEARLVYAALPRCGPTITSGTLFTSVTIYPKYLSHQPKQDK